MYTEIQSYLKLKESYMSGFTEAKTRALCVCFRNTADVAPVVRFYTDTGTAV